MDDRKPRDERKHRRERIEFLLDHWDDIFSPREGGITTSGDAPTGVPMLSPMSHHPSVIELVRLLEVARRRWPTHYRHLVGFYTSPWRQTRSPKSAASDPARPEQWIYGKVRVVPGWVSAGKVELAVDGISGQWSLPNGVDIPVELSEWGKAA